MRKTSFAARLLKDKLPDSSEIELHLFDLCNLRCSFCGQKHDETTGMNEILSKIEPVIEFIKSNSRESHILNIMGGEVFSDEVPDRLFEDYFALCQAIHAAAQSRGHRCQFNWVTNLIFEKRERVEAFFRRLDEVGMLARVSTSYDFSGRKSRLWSEETFRRNLDTFADRINTIGFVLTKPAVHFLLNKTDPFFEELYERFPLYFDTYVPEAGAALLNPSDEEILKAYLFIARKYPRINPVHDLLVNEENKMTCYSLNKLTLLPNGKEVKCRYLKYKDGDFKNPIDELSNENIILAHVEENHCLSCQWYRRCSFRCFVQADWSKRVRTPDCLFKEFFAQTASQGTAAWS